MYYKNTNPGTFFKDENTLYFPPCPQKNGIFYILLVVSFNKMGFKGNADGLELLCFLSFLTKKMYDLICQKYEKNKGLSWPHKFEISPQKWSLSQLSAS